MYFFPNKPRLFSVLTQPHCHSMGYFLLEKNSFRQQHSAKKNPNLHNCFFSAILFSQNSTKKTQYLVYSKTKNILPEICQTVGMS